MLDAAAERAWELEERIKRSCRTLRQEWASLAASLYAFSKARYWQNLGYETFEAWLRSPEIEIGRRHAYLLIEAYRELVVERGVTEAVLATAEVTKVREVLPAVRRGEATAEQALADCRSLSREDLAIKYRGGEEHEPTRWEVCSACGSRYSVRA